MLLYIHKSYSTTTTRLYEKVSEEDDDRVFHHRGRRRTLRRHPAVSSDTYSDGHSSGSRPPSSRPDFRHRRLDHSNRRQQQSRPSPLVCRRCLMPRPVFPVVRLPYDQPDRVARVLDAVRREFKASGRQPAAPGPQPQPTAGAGRGPSRTERCGPTITARVLQQSACREPENHLPAAGMQIATAPYAEPGVDQVTVGVRDCTLTPKSRPEILVTAGCAPNSRTAYLNDLRRYSTVTPAGDVDCGGPYLLVPPVNITAEISRPPLQTPQ